MQLYLSTAPKLTTFGSNRTFSSSPRSDRWSAWFVGLFSSLVLCLRTWWTWFAGSVYGLFLAVRAQLTTRYDPMVFDTPINRLLKYAFKVPIFIATSPLIIFLLSVIGTGVSEFPDWVGRYWLFSVLDSCLWNTIFILAKFHPYSDAWVCYMTGSSKSIIGSVGRLVSTAFGTIFIMDWENMWVAAGARRDAALFVESKVQLNPQMTALERAEAFDQQYHKLIDRRDGTALLQSTMKAIGKAISNLSSK